MNAPLLGQRPAVPALALSCPRCAASASPQAVAQICGGCRGTFVLRAGALIDGALVVPSADPTLSRIVVKSAGIVLLKRGVVAPEGVTEGTLDPITGLIPMDQSGVLFHDIFTVAVWRKIDIFRLIFALLMPTPIALFLVFEAVVIHPGLLVAAFPFAFIAAYMIYRAAGLRANMVRIAGGVRVITIRFDSPIWRRRRFHDELLRRAGISPSAIP